MKHLRPLLAVLVGLSASPATATDYVVAVPRSLPKAEARHLYSRVEQFVMQVAVADDTVLLFDAAGVETIATLAIPEGGASRIDALRAKALAPGLVPWKAFVKKHYLGDDAAAGSPILLPQTLTYLATQVFGHARADQPVCILAVGSANHVDPREPDYSMAEGRFPSDGLLAASQNKSPYGTADRQGRLHAVNLHMMYLDKDFQSDAHRLRIERVWHLFVKSQGGSLATFAADYDTALDRFGRCVRDPARSFAWDSTRAVEAMITTDRTADLALLPENPAPQAPELANDDWLRNENVPVSGTAPAVTQTALKIGIRWGDQGSCANSDIDLYFRSSAERPYLFFQNKESADGQYFKDFQTAPDATNGLEYVDVTDRVALADMDVRLNHFKGRYAGGAMGTVRAYANGQVYQMPFHIPAETGNGGSAMNVPGSPHWVKIDTRKLFHLN